MTRSQFRQNILPPRRCRRGSAPEWRAPGPGRCGRDRATRAASAIRRRLASAQGRFRGPAMASSSFSCLASWLANSRNAGGNGGRRRYGLAQLVERLVVPPGAPASAMASKVSVMELPSRRAALSSGEPPRRRGSAPAAPGRESSRGQRVALVRPPSTPSASRSRLHAGRCICGAKAAPPLSSA